MIDVYAHSTVTLKSLLDNSVTKTFIDKCLSEYPLYKPEKKYDLIPTREELNTKLLDHYKYREIGFETVGRFCDELRITMNEIMPKYNELFKTIVIMADLENPFDNVDVVETFDQTKTGTSSSNGNTTENIQSDGTTSNEQNSTNSGNTSETRSTDGTSSTTENGSEDVSSTSERTQNHTRKFSDTPQNAVANVDNYLTEYTKENDTVNQTDTSGTTKENTLSGTTSEDVTSSGTVSGESNTTDSGTSSMTTESSGTSHTENETLETSKHTYTKKGNQGVNTFAHDILEYREQIRDIVYEIITDKRVNELFMLVY